MQEGTEVGRVGETDRIVTLPNIVTLIRLSCLPIFLWLLFARDNRVGAALVLAGLGATDWVDGQLARRLGQVSPVGKVLDPVADRLLFFVGAGGILIDGSVPTWFAVIVLVREGLVAAATLLLAALGAKRIDVTWAGKKQTALMMMAFPFFLAGNADWWGGDFCWVMGWVTGIPGLVLSLYSAAAYVPLARRAFTEGRAARATAET